MWDFFRRGGKETPKEEPELDKPRYNGPTPVLKDTNFRTRDGRFIYEYIPNAGQDPDVALTTDGFFDRVETPLLNGDYIKTGGRYCRVHIEYKHPRPEITLTDIGSERP